MLLYLFKVTCNILYLQVPITFKKGGFIKAANGIKLKLERR